MVHGGAAEETTVRHSPSWERASPNSKAVTDPMAMRFQGLKGELQKAEERVSSCSQGVEVSWEQSAKRLSSMESGLELLTDRLTVLNNQVQTMTDSSACNTSGVETGLTSDGRALVAADALEQLEQQLCLLCKQLNQRIEDITNRVDELAQLKLVDNHRLDALEEQILAHSQRLERFQAAKSCYDTNADGETDQSSKETLASLRSRMDALAKLLSTEGQLREASISRLEWHFRQAHGFPQQPTDQERCAVTPGANPKASNAEAWAPSPEARGPEEPVAATPASDLDGTRLSQCTEIRDGQKFASRMPSQIPGSEVCSAVAAGGAAGNPPDDAAARNDTAGAHAATPPPDDQLDRTVQVVVPVTVSPAPPSKNNVASSPALKPSNTTLTFTSPPVRQSSTTLPPAASGSEGWPPLSHAAVTTLAGSPYHTAASPLSPDRLTTNVRVTRSSSMPQFTAVPPGPHLSTSRFPQPPKGGTSKGCPSAGNREDEPIRTELRKMFEMAPEHGPWQAMSSRQRTLSSTHSRGGGAVGQSRGCLLASTNSPPPPHSSWSGSAHGVQLSPGSTRLTHAPAATLPLALDAAAASSPSPLRSSRRLGTGMMHRSRSSSLPLCPSPVPALPGPSTAVGF